MKDIQEEFNVEMAALLDDMAYHKVMWQEKMRRFKEVAARVEEIDRELEKLFGKENVK